MKVTLGQSSNVGPAVVSVPNLGTIIAWMGGGSALVLMLSTDGVNFQAPVKLWTNHTGSAFSHHAQRKGFRRLDEM